MRFRQNKKRRIAFIDISVVINVMILILIYSLLSMSSLEQTSPVLKKSTGELPLKNFALLVVMPGKIVLDGKTVAYQALKSIPAQKDIVIQPSKDISYSRLAGILDTLKTSGHTSISLSTRPTH